VHLLSHGQVCVLAAREQTVLAGLSRLPAADNPARRYLTAGLVPSSPSRPVRARLARLVRWLAGRNTLRRPVDRIEGAVLVVLTAAFLVAMAVASAHGAHTYRSQRATAAGLRPVVAVLSQAGPRVYGSTAQLGLAEARWPDQGREQSGVLTTATAPGIIGAPAGARVPVWLDPSGRSAGPPAGQAGLLVSALAASAAVAGGAGMTLLICYGLCRLVLDRRRLMAWESAWSLTGPRWTTRR
jgi:hypothetical protein